MSGHPFENGAVSSILREISLPLELKGENPFKVRAHLNPARSIEIMEEDLRTILGEGRLKEIEGSGEIFGRERNHG